MTTRRTPKWSRARRPYQLAPGEKVLIPREAIGEKAMRPLTYIEDETGCFIVHSHHAKVSRGYPRITANGRQMTVSRFVYTHYFGEIPAGMVVCHSCDNPSCCNPKHLWAGTYQDNSKDMITKGRGRKFSIDDIEALRRKMLGQPGLRGERNPRAKLSKEQVEMIRAERPNKTLKQLAAKYGVHYSTIQKIVYGEHWNA